MIQKPSTLPFIAVEHASKLIELVVVEGDDCSPEKILGAVSLLSRKYPNIVLTIPPYFSLGESCSNEIKSILEKINLIICCENESQIQFQHDFEIAKDPVKAVTEVKKLLIIEEVLKEFSDVTPFKSSALNLLNEIGTPDVEFKQIEEQIISEPLLVARILQTANSSFFMRRNRVENIGHALAYLGMEGIKQVLMQMIFNNLATKYFSQQEKKLAHSDACAFLAVKLAERVTGDPITVGKIRVAALLHDIGSLALQYAFHEKYEIVAKLISEKSMDSVAAEREIFGIDHCELGVALCQHWKLPEYVTRVVSAHHSLPEEKENILQAIICANGFLNMEVERIPFFNYLPYLQKYAKGKFETPEEAIAQVKDMLKKTWEGYGAEKAASEN